MVEIREKRLIETDRFPIGFLSKIAIRESWRKEVYRPVYHMHKWWAKRLGSIFRGIILGCVLPESSTLSTEFYKKQDFSHVVVFDPFMGSGTTVGEAHKLGARSIGRDINPVACEAVRVSLGRLDPVKLREAYEGLWGTVGRRILDLYGAEDDTGSVLDVLYYFWVMQAECPSCRFMNDLFSSRILASNAYPQRKPTVQICCPACGHIFPGLHGSLRVGCPRCGDAFSVNEGAARGAKAACQRCGEVFSVSQAIRSRRGPPSYRLYAKLLLTPDGQKKYLATTTKDEAAFSDARRLLWQEVSGGQIRLPVDSLTDGHNTRQAMNYGFLHWRDFFNDRQLLALGWLNNAIDAIQDDSSRDALLLIFSGVLEFSNMFASYKGEGTGAVRHMFSHHILKPERAPIEANVWGTPKSSGSFTNLFQGRLLRALKYRAAPFEVGLNREGKEAHCSPPFSGEVSTVWPTDGDFSVRGIYLSCGDSAQTRLPNGSVDLVVTDPPFFDNVHYSELADFFFAWQKLCPRGFVNGASTTRDSREVQDTDASSFANKLTSIFVECRRVLKDDGLLVFSYHHSRDDGWIALAEAVLRSGFSIVNAHPVRAEMTVAAPKSQAKEPIQLDVLLVCRKREQDERDPTDPLDIERNATRSATRKAELLVQAGLCLSKNDIRVILLGEVLCSLGPTTPESAASVLSRLSTFPIPKHMTRLVGKATTRECLRCSSEENELPLFPKDG